VSSTTFRKRSVERQALRRQLTERHRLDAVATDLHRHLDAGFLGQTLDEVLVADVPVELGLDAGIERADELARELVVALDLQLLAGIERAFDPLPLGEVVLGAPQVLVDLDPVPRDLVVVARNQGTYRRCLGGLGRSIRTAEQLDLDAPTEALGVRSTTARSRG
jgi:hypothetical protein